VEISSLQYLETIPVVPTCRFNMQTSVRYALSISTTSSHPNLSSPIKLNSIGYNFHSLEEIQPYLEPTTGGITTRWAIQVAQHYNCTVTVGYPELTITEPKTQCTCAYFSPLFPSNLTFSCRQFYSNHLPVRPDPQKLPQSISILHRRDMGL
jgi:hypothetical protein